MSRVKGGNKRLSRRKKILRMAKGFFGGRKNLFRTAMEAVDRSMEHAYVGRRIRKRDFRKLWITRINAAAREHDLSYSRFISGLKSAGVDLNRKALADLAVREPEAFAELAKLAKEHSH